ncbi:hypothetical protein NP493_100g07011 [Ridgeia piscesae]|uniref:Uncharacterized protein n=1 Tax=Ridgeia piscesae TaxID=27915 RepID=A0AAD9P7M3_RIDPI|nr:hypothetical protein NP493_100g07011 [Ridgeia piscesae]
MRRRTQNSPSTGTSLKEVKHAVAESKKSTKDSEPSSDVVKLKPVPLTRKRRCLNVLMYVALVLFSPAFLNYASLTRERVLFSPGKLYEIGSGQRLYMNCSGTGSPTGETSLHKTIQGSD